MSAYAIALALFLLAWRWLPRPRPILKAIVGAGFLLLAGGYAASIAASGHPLTSGEGLPVVAIAGLIGLGGLIYLFSAVTNNTASERVFEASGLLLLAAAFAIPASFIVFLPLIAVLAGASLGLRRKESNRYTPTTQA